MNKNNLQVDVNEYIYYLRKTFGKNAEEVAKIKWQDSLFMVCSDECREFFDLVYKQIKEQRR